MVNVEITGITPITLQGRTQAIKVRYRRNSLEENFSIVSTGDISISDFDKVIDLDEIKNIISRKICENFYYEEEDREDAE